MDMLQKLFPLSFGKVKAQDTNSLIVAVIVYVVAMLVSGLVMKLLGPGDLLRHRPGAGCAEIPE